MKKFISRLMCSLIAIAVLGFMPPNQLKVHAERHDIIQYKIKKGDTFYLLGLRFNSSGESISNMNAEMDPYNLKIGSKVKVPVGSGTKLHYVKKGDTLGTLSYKYDSTIELISEKNNISNPNLIYTGDILSIPKLTLTDINAIVIDINNASREGYGGFGNARFENGCLKIDMYFNLVVHEYSMKIIKQILDKHNVKQVDYNVENVIWDCPPGVHCTSRHGTVCIKIDKK
ncbi:LysM peptidoglycan-binding domain-containing protein [Bacillus sp. HMF5848]|uniref:LysM peptidoglycan-binding domain-containing protein n=1 Tax=Bacillus sp. HMF5848 TaxID=2495421 RepID=UPI000F7843BE|nr:LysM peptidoglycan-binding domain-containing protein [Bacillus sp. HMF5848]RSK26081.1 LysM peptidoglycan-binding domain-containing protein [Bacillus sp. HMF5848]